MKAEATRFQLAGFPLIRIADWLAVATAVSLPWSTSATGLLVVCWVLAVLPTLDRQSWHGIAATMAVLLPVVLVAYAIVGTLWADVAWAARLRGIAPFSKLLVIPLLIAHFRRSDAADLVFKSVLVSLCVLLAASFCFALFQGLPRSALGYGVPVKDYISQSGFFALCAVVLVDRALEVRKTAPRAALLLAAGAVLFIVNILFVAVGRTTLVSLAVLLVLVGVRHFSRMALLTYLGVLVLICATAWVASPYLRDRVSNVVVELRDFRPGENDTSSGARIAFWKLSAEIVRQAPLFGHGTGATREIMSRHAGADPAAPGAPSNPHNQPLATAIPLGLVGVALMLAMWFAHGRLFLAPGQVAWIGMAVVVQNIVGGIFNAHLFDFTQGWLYVLGVGIAGGALMRERAARPRSDGFAVASSS